MKKFLKGLKLAKDNPGSIFTLVVACFGASAIAVGLVEESSVLMAVVVPALILCIATVAASFIAYRSHRQWALKNLIRGLRSNEDRLEIMESASVSIQGCIDSARQLGKPDILSKALKAQKLLPDTAVEYLMLKEAFKKTSSSFEKSCHQARMNAIEAELMAVHEYFQEQRKIIEESLSAVGRNPVMLEELPATSALSGLIGNEAKTEPAEEPEASAKGPRVLRLERKNGTEK